MANLEEHIKKNTYICAVCEKEYRKGWSDDEAVKEMVDIFGEQFLESDEIEAVCDPCFKKLYKI